MGNYGTYIDSNSEIGAQERSNLCYLIWLRHLFRSGTFTKRIFFSKKTDFPLRNWRKLGYQRYYFFFKKKMYSLSYNYDILNFAWYLTIIIVNII